MMLAEKGHITIRAQDHVTGHSVRESGHPQSSAARAPDGAPQKSTAIQILLLFLGVIAFLYFARVVLLPVVLACMGTMALKPLMRGFARLRIPTVPSAMIIFLVLLATVGIGFFQLGRPAIGWIDEAPEHMAALRTRVSRLFPNAVHFSRALTEATDLAVAEGKSENAKKVATVEINDQRGTTSILNWTSSFLGGLGEVLVLIYLLLASGDMFMQKLVRVMPTRHEKKRAVAISHDVQSNISDYLFSVSVINVCLGVVASFGFFLIGVQRPAMWGMLIALLNYVPYFGPVAGAILLGVVGLLSFDTLFQVLMPVGWYLLLHLLEANFVTPILLGRRFTLNPVAIFVSLIFWLWLWGVPGVLLSVPILVSVKAVCDRIPKASFVSDLISR